MHPRRILCTHTVHLSITLDATQTSVYAVAGTTDIPMSFPAAYQCATPFGADIGGANPQFFAIANNAALGYAEFDSWLTVGVTDGSAPGAIAASPGFDLATWTETAGISQTNAAIFFMDPATMGANSGTGPIVMAQMTVSAETVTAASGTATAKLQGRSVSGDDWESPVVWTHISSAAVPLRCCSTVSNCDCGDYCRTGSCGDCLRSRPNTCISGNSMVCSMSCCGADWCDTHRPGWDTAEIGVACDRSC